MKRGPLDVVIMATPPAILLSLVAALFLYTDSTIRSAIEARDARPLFSVFPEATRFSEKTGEPPHIKAFAGDSGGSEERLVGLLFHTDELEPYERGYDGPIRMLVGVDLEGRIAGVEILEHREPYGYFSIDPPAFGRQFAGKSVEDRFRVGDDIDAVSRATITIVSATRAIRNSARRMASAYLPERVTSP